MALFFNSWILFGVLKALAEDGLDFTQGTLVSRCLIRTRPRNYFSAGCSFSALSDAMSELVLGCTPSHRDSPKSLLVMAPQRSLARCTLLIRLNAWVVLQP